MTSVDMDVSHPVNRHLGRRRAVVLRLATDYVSIAFVLIKGLFLIPLYLRSFSVAAYGAWLASGNVLALIGAMEGGFTLVYSQRLAESFGDGDHDRYSREAGAGGLVLGILALLIGVVAVALSPFVPLWVGAASEDRRALSQAFGAVGVSLALTLTQSILNSHFNAWQRPVSLGLIRITCQIIEVGLIVAWLNVGWGLLAIGMAGAVAATIALLLTVGVTVREWRRLGLPFPRVAGKASVDFVKVAFPVFLSRVGSVVLNNNEPWIAAVTIGPVAAAILGLTDRIFKMCQIISNQAAAAAYYGVAHLRGEDRNGTRTQKVTDEIIRVSSAVMAVTFSIAILINPRFIELWIGGDRFAGFGMNALLGVANLLAVRANLFGVLLAGLGGNRDSAWCQVAELVIRVGLLIVLLRLFGMAGLPLAVIATSGGFVVWLYALRLGVWLRLGWVAGLRQVFSGTKGMFVPLALSLVASRWMPREIGWYGLASTAFISTIVFSTIVGLLDRAVQKNAILVLTAIHILRPKSETRSS